jgi:hypothetical protein
MHSITNINDIPDIIYMIDVARLGGCTQAAGWNWRRRFYDFPKKIGLRIGKNNRLCEVFDKNEMLAFLIRHKKIAPIEGINPDDYFDERSIKNIEPSYPQIDNSLAIQFITGHIGKTMQIKILVSNKAIRTQGVWPI